MQLKEFPFAQLPSLLTNFALLLQSLETLPSLEHVQCDCIQTVLRESNGNISETARRMGLHRGTVRRKMRQYCPLA